MKAVILAGGFGTRLSEETDLKPKPLVNIGGKPVIWHIMKFLNSYNINHFVICCGYKGYMIKEYFANYNLYNSDIEIYSKNSKIKILKKNTENWKITLIDTGNETMTGGRLLRIKNLFKKNENFLFTYGDGLTNVNINKLISHHKSKKKIATVTAVLPPGRFGSIKLNRKNNDVLKFSEKPEGDGSYINGGYFILNQKVFKYLKNDKSIWEEEPLRKLANQNELSAYKHNGFWKAMDTLREKRELNKLWKNNDASWRIWK